MMRIMTRAVREPPCSYWAGVHKCFSWCLLVVVARDIRQWHRVAGGSRRLVICSILLMWHRLWDRCLGIALGIGADGVGGYDGCCLGCGPIMPPCDEGNGLGGGGGVGGCCSAAPGIAGQPKTTVGALYALGGIGPWQPGQILAVQCMQNRLFESISWPQLGHLLSALILHSLIASMHRLKVSIIVLIIHPGQK